MMRKIVFLFLVLVVFSCRKSEKPAGVLSKAEMEKTIRELYLAEEKVKRLSITQDSSLKVFAYMKSKILEEKGIQDSVFNVSFNYYMDHPQQLELIYTAMVDSLQLAEQRTSEKVNP